MKLIKIKRSSYSLLINFFLLYIIFSFVLRIGFSIASLQKAEISFLSLLNVFALGFLFDIGVGVFFVLPYSLYLLLFPQKYNNSLFNRAMTFFCFNVAVLILLFSFFAEVTFWQEFESRFNFIAVDYLVYTYEVINNINESYPLPLLITAMLIMTSLVFLLFYKRHYFTDNFKGSTPFLQRFFIFFGLLFISVIYIWAASAIGSALALNMFLLSFLATVLTLFILSINKFGWYKKILKIGSQSDQNIYKK